VVEGARAERWVGGVARGWPPGGPRGSGHRADVAPTRL